MGKVIKILGKIFSWLIITIVTLPLLVALLLNIEAVQNFVVHKATEILSAKLETTLSIDRIRIRGFNTLTAEGVYIQDYAGDTLIYAAKVGASISRSALLRNQIIIGNASLDEAKVYLFTNKDGVMNLTQILDRISSQDTTTSNTKLVFKNVDITNSRFKFQNEGADTINYGVNYGNMIFSDLDISSKRFEINGAAITMDIKNMSFRDVSGFVVEKMTADKFLLDDGIIDFDNARIITPDSDMKLKMFRMEGRSWEAMTDILDSVRFDARLKNSTLTMRTLSLFVPTFNHESQLDMTDIDAVFGGYINDFKTTVSLNASKEVTHIDADVAISKVTDIPRAGFDIDIRKMITTGTGAEEIINGITSVTFDQNVKDIFNRAGNISLKAKAKGQMSNFTADVNAIADVGNVSVKGSGGLLMESGDSKFNVRAIANELAAGRLLGNKLLGNITIDAKAAGYTGKKTTDINGSVFIPLAEFNGYTYSQIMANGSYANDKVEADITSGDPKLQFILKGAADFSEAVPYYDVDLDMKSADLFRLNVNPKDSTSIISGRIVAKGSGSNLDNINGEAVITDLTYRSSVDDVVADSITFTGQNNETSKFLAINSSYADVEFKSGISYKEIIDYLTHIIYDYVPALDPKHVADDHHNDYVTMRTVHESDVTEGYRYHGEGLPENAPTYTNNAEQSEHKKDDNHTETNALSELHVNIKKANNIAAIFLPGFSIAEGTKVDFVFDPSTEIFSLKANSDYIEYGKFFVTRLGLSADNTTALNAATLTFTTEDLYLPSFSMPSNNIKVLIRNNNIDINAHISNNTSDLNAFIDIHSSLSRTQTNNELQIGVMFNPSSYITTGTRRWDISSDSILYNPERIVIENFRVASDDQKLFVDGVLSSQKTDTLRLSLDRLSVRPVNAILGFKGVAIDGSLDGYAELISGMKDPVMIADIRIDSLSAGGYVSAPLVLRSDWDFAAERASVSLKNTASDQNIIRGFYRPNTGNYFANVDVDKVPAAVAALFLPEDLVKNIKGTVAALLEVRGSTGMPQIDGTISISDLETTVNITNVTYLAKTIDIDIDKNIVAIPNTVVTDTENNKATLEAYADIRNTANIRYEVNLKPDNLIGLNTGPKDNEQFYGKVYVSGVVNLKGSKSGVNIDVAATTQNNSTFYLPLSNKSSISEADWITFHSIQPVVTAADILAQKKQEYEQALKSSVNKSEITDVNLNVSLNITPGTLVSIIIPTINSELSARGSASLDVQLNPSTGELAVYGTYEVTDGDFYFSLPPLISNKKFVLQPGGTIQLSGDPMDATLNVEALYRVRASLQPIASSLEGLGISPSTRVPVECIISIRESLSHPNIAFDVKIPSADGDIQSALSSILSTNENTALNFLSLVGLNSFLPDGNADASGSARSSASSLGIDFLTSQLTNLISNENMNIMLRYRTDEVYSDELDFGISYNLGNDRVILEVEGNYDLGNNNPQNVSNMTGDASITWLVTPTGNIRLKGFTRTINRYDENQGLQENGIGVYYRDDFNSFKDIPGQIRLRNEVRIKERNAKRAEAAQKAAAKRTSSSATLQEAPIKAGSTEETRNTDDQTPSRIEQRRVLIEEERERRRMERRSENADDTENTEVE